MLLINSLISQGTGKGSTKYFQNCQLYVMANLTVLNHADNEEYPIQFQMNLIFNCHLIVMIVIVMITFTCTMWTITQPASCATALQLWWLVPQREIMKSKWTGHQNLQLQRNALYLQTHTHTPWSCSLAGALLQWCSARSRWLFWFVAMPAWREGRGTASVRLPPGNSEMSCDWTKDMYVNVKT